MNLRGFTVHTPTVTVLDGGQSSLVDTVYLLRRDENRRWKIYGWDLAANVDPRD